MKWHFFFLQKLNSSTCFRVSEPEGCGKIQEWCILWVHLWFLIPSLLTNCWSWTHNLGGEVQNVYILSHLLHTRWSQGTLFLGNMFHFIMALHGHHSHLYKRKWKLWELNEFAHSKWRMSHFKLHLFSCGDPASVTPPRQLSKVSKGARASGLQPVKGSI